ncbi:MAG: molybdopterin dinucleotide binding domain-containing protein [Promethearchaeota archaeon]
MDMILNTVRKIDHDQAKELALENYSSLKEAVAIAMMNLEDMKSIGITEASNIKATSEFGSVVLRVIKNDNVPSHMLYVPISIWINQITGVSKEGLVLKNIKIDVEKSNDPVLSFEEILKTIRRE